ncbi:hypothetical protein PSAB6_60030 [Paraburkholderia sabiae]|nr:hypothetical protein PSAB6_60030 [Paraburkholderia sabiae]
MEDRVLPFHIFAWSKQRYFCTEDVNSETFYSRSNNIISVVDMRISRTSRARTSGYGKHAAGSTE